MNDPISFFLIFLGVMAVGAAVFAVWVVAMIVRVIGRAFVGLFRWDAMPRMSMGGPTRRCPRRGCQAVNPSSARFCRRCGRELLQGQAGFGARLC